MKLHLIPLVLAIVIPAMVYVEVVQRNQPQVAALQARVLNAATQVDTVNASTIIRPRLALERAAIADRLSAVRAFGPSEAQSTFLLELAEDARFHHIRLVTVVSRGRPVPFAAATATPGPHASPTPAAMFQPGAAAAPAPPPPAVSALASGVTIPQQVVASGSLSDLLRFTDDFGRFSVPVQVANVSFSSAQALTITILCDIVVVSSTDLADAKRRTPVLVPAPRLTPSAALSARLISERR